MTHPGEFPCMHHAGTADSVPRLSLKSYTRLSSSPELCPVCRQRHARDVSLCGTVILTPQKGPSARGCQRIRGQGVAIWNLEELFSPEGRRHRAGGLFASWPRDGQGNAARSPAHGTLFTAGELRSSFPRKARRNRDPITGDGGNPNGGGRRDRAVVQFPANTKMLRPQSLLPVSYLSKYHAPIRNDEKINATTRSAVRSQIMRISCV